MKKNLIILTVLIAMLFGNLQVFAKTKAFQYPAKDGFNMTGNVYLPKMTPGKKVPLVVLLHSIGSSKNDWKDLPEQINAKGYACLALDLRGHGQSIYNSKMKQRSWMYFTDVDYTKYPQDLIFAIDAIKVEYAKQIDTRKMIFVGCNIGANTAVIAASKINKQGNFVRSLVMISPRLNTKKLFIPLELVSFGQRPVLIFDNKNSIKGFNETLEIKKYAQGNCVLKVLPTPGMAMSLYKSSPSIKTDILNWLTTIFNQST
jgi:pimeloyl-ACP methyl ester carboxylesterase